MVTVKKLLHEIFTEDTIKVLAIGFMADDSREKSRYAVLGVQKVGEQQKRPATIE